MEEFFYKRIMELWSKTNKDKVSSSVWTLLQLNIKLYLENGGVKAALPHDLIDHELFDIF
jgi:hypothetical protein